MLFFATEFPIAATCRTRAFIEAVRFWLLHSPHTSFAAEDLRDVPFSGPWSVIKPNERFDALLFADADEEAAAIRHSKVDGDINWETTAVFSATAENAWVSVRTSRESNHPATRLPPAKKPRLIRTLLERLGGASDGQLPVAGEAYRLTNNEIELAANLVKGEAGCHLPVVYISCGFNGKHAIDINSVAYDLAGMAHVVSEPNRPFSQRLQIEVNSENVYGGAIGIYWPNGQGRRFFLNQSLKDARTIKREIAEEIRTALLNRRPMVRCTWSSVEESFSRLTYKALKESGSNEIDRYTEAFDSELKAKQELIQDAEREISRLQAEVRKLESNVSSTTGITLQLGKEQDFFPNEIQQVVRDAIDGAQEHVPNDSRRAHILHAIVENTPRTDAAKEYKEILKETLRAYRTMDGKTRKVLENMGFSISEEGKHYKLVFQNDDRYTFTLSKSGSDHRGGLNAASDIAKRLF